MAFLFERLDSYNKAVFFADQVDILLDSNRTKISRGIADQLTRASLSISLNIAEGNGRWHVADKKQFFYVARGSVFECIPLLQVLKSRNVLPEERHKALYLQAENLSKMISGLIKSTESKTTARSTGDASC